VYRARAGDRDGSLEALEQLLDKGDGFLPTTEFFPSLGEERRFAVLRARFERRLPRTDGAVTKVTLSDRTLIPEGIAYDPDTRRVYVGSIARRGVFRVDTAGRTAPFSRAEDDLDAILGLAIDAKRRRLYAVSTSALIERGRAALRNAVKIYDLDREILLQSIAVPQAQQLNDVAFTSDGTLLVTDSAAGGALSNRSFDRHRKHRRQAQRRPWRERHRQRARRQARLCRRIAPTPARGSVDRRGGAARASATPECRRDRWPLLARRGPDRGTECHDAGSRRPPRPCA
jgi:hypothetical protein